MIIICYKYYLLKVSGKRYTGKNWPIKIVFLEFLQSFVSWYTKPLGEHVSTGTRYVPLLSHLLDSVNVCLLHLEMRCQEGLSQLRRYERNSLSEVVGRPHCTKIRPHSGNSLYKYFRINYTNVSG